MGTVPTIATFAASGVVTSAYLNTIKAAYDFVNLPPKCSCYQTTGTTLTTSVGGAIGFDTEVFDVVQSGDTPGHDLVTTNSRIFFRTPGKYEIMGQVQFLTNATGIRVAAIRLNSAGSYTGGTLIVQNSQVALTGGSTSASAGPYEYPFAAGDYIELFGWQNSGGNLGTATGLGNTFLRTKFVGS